MVAAQTSFTNQSSFTGDVAELDETSTKLTEKKNADAVPKLVDLRTTLNSLAGGTEAKVDAGTAQTLNGEAQRVIHCINAIGTGTTTA